MNVYRPLRAACLEAPLLEVRLRPPLLLPRGALLIVGVLVMLGLGWLTPRLQELLPGVPPEQVPPAAFSVAAALLCILGFVLRTRRRSGPVIPIQAYGDRLRLPVRPGSRRSLEARYPELMSLDIVGAGQEAQLVVGTRQKLLLYPLTAFEAPAQAEELRALVRELLQSSGNAEALAGLDQREALARDVRGRPLWVTWTLCSLLVVVFAVEYFSGATEGPLALLELGANAPALVYAGEIHRVFSASFLHVNPLHLLVNGYALLVLGATLERLIGSWRFALLYFASALAGALMSVAFSTAVYSVGASGAVFGLLGALGWVQWRSGQSLPTGFGRSWRSWVFVLGLNAILPLLVPQIDVAAHLGGLAAGGVSAALFGHDRELARAPLTGYGTRSLAILLGSAHALALVYALLPSATAPKQQRLELLQAYEGGSSSPDALHAVAALSAIAPDATHEELELARRAAERAFELRPESDIAADLLARIEYRLGNLERAIQLELALARRLPGSFFSDQTARFLGEFEKQKGVPLHLGPDAPPLELMPVPAAAGPAHLRLKLGGPLSKGAEIWWLDDHQGQTRGYGILRLGPTLELERMFAANLPAYAGSAGVALRPALIDAHACVDCQEGSVSWRYFQN